jgi:methionyl-tRNA formyltransferase
LTLLFFGSGAFGVPTLRGLVAAGWAPRLVVSQPSRPRGRSGTEVPPPLAAAAMELGLEVRQPARVHEEAVLQELAALAPDLALVVAYGQILRRRLLDLPRRGCVNLHASLLPRHRGASPIQAAILAGDLETGVTLMQMDEGLDSGPILAQRRTPVGAGETAGELHDRLAELGRDLVLEALAGVLRGELVPRPQDPGQVTRCGLVRKDDGRLDPREPASLLARKVRAYQPWPGAALELAAGGRVRRVLVGSARAEPGGRDAPPGTLLWGGPEGLLIQTGEGILRVLSLKPEGRAMMSAGEFARGFLRSAGPGPGQ